MLSVKGVNGETVLAVIISGSTSVDLYRAPPGSGTIERVGAIGSGTIENLHYASADEVLYSSKTSATGTELWRYDRRSQASSLVADLSPGAADSVIESVQTLPTSIIVNVRVRDIAGATLRYELWAIANETKTLQRLAELNSPIRPGIVDGTNLRFLGSDQAGRLFAVSTDGTPLGTMVSNPDLGSGRFFPATAANHFVITRILPAGSSETILASPSLQRLEVLPPLNPGYPNQVSASIHSARSFIIAGSECWVSDGTALGTTRLFTAAEGTSLSSQEGPEQDLFVISGSRTISAGNQERSYSIIDGSTNRHTTVVAAPGGSFSNSRLIDRQFFFRESVNTRSTYFNLDGATLTVAEVALPVYGNQGSAPLLMGRTSTRALYTMLTPDFGFELWGSDGTGSGTELIADLTPGVGSTTYQLLAEGPDGVALHATTNSGQFTVFTDGTPRRTVVKPALTSGSGASEMIFLNGSFYFSTRSTLGIPELWRIDQLGEGATLVASIGDGAAPQPARLAVLGANLYFFRERASTAGSVELWRSDGTTSGTEFVTTLLAPTETGTGPSQISVSGNRLYFDLGKESTGRELWMSDGSAAGTQMLPELAVGPADSFRVGEDWIRTFRGGALFTRSDSDGNRRLERIVIGMEQAIVVERSFSPSSEEYRPISDPPIRVTPETEQTFLALLQRSTSNASARVAQGNILIADESDRGLRNLPLPLGISDSVGGGVGFESSGFQFLSVSPAEQPYNSQLLITDGSEIGSLLLDDPNPGVGGTAPTGFAPIGQEVLFAALAPGIGSELHRLSGLATLRESITIAGTSPAKIKARRAKAGRARLTLQAQPGARYELLVETTFKKRIRVRGGKTKVVVRKKQRIVRSARPVIVLRGGTKNASVQLSYRWVFANGPAAASLRSVPLRLKTNSKKQFRLRR
jgi:ELWxxDGT repeat protein